MTAAPIRTPVPLSKARVLVTGGTAGVGLGTAIRFAREGAAFVGINGRNPERGEKARAAAIEAVPDAPMCLSTRRSAPTPTCSTRSTSTTSPAWSPPRPWRISG